MSSDYNGLWNCCKNHSCAFMCKTFSVKHYSSLSLPLSPTLPLKKKNKNEIAYEHTGLFGNSSVNAIKKFLLQRETVIYIYITVAVQWTLYAE